MYYVNVTFKYSIGLSEVKDCYNLMLETAPLTLGRSGNDGFYEIIWPEKKKIAIVKTETVLFRDEGKLYLWEWYEDPEYHENINVKLRCVYSSICLSYIEQMK